MFTETLQHGSIQNHISQYCEYYSGLDVCVHCKVCQSSSDVIAKHSVNSVRDGRVVICDIYRHHPRESDMPCELYSLTVRHNGTPVRYCISRTIDIIPGKILFNDSQINVSYLDRTQH